ncbi:hypothetical protein BT96DRAFT_951372 [Gymnopus androsaceus JB14]|uniref:Uncharacterized protein n=1 Tax=Gymnopus androsaceus JB14 TaxID=1447944 RepID=A0A6A4GD98_9AGAR|nr:hypothetical protein BT96DRAFT_951372 [Gymnopus androsaceus JB14]
MYYCGTRYRDHKAAALDAPELPPALLDPLADSPVDALTHLQPSLTASSATAWASATPREHETSSSSEDKREIDIFLKRFEDRQRRILLARSCKYLSASIDITTLDISTLSWVKFGESMKVVHSGQPDTPAELSMIGRVDGRNSELRPDSGYTVRQLRLVVRAPRDELMKRKFQQALQTLDCLLDKQRAPSIGWKADGVTFNELGDFYARDRRVVFQHRLFKVLEDGDKIDHTYADKFYVWSTAGWPVNGEHATRELKEMVSSKSHIVSALNIEGCYLFDIDSPEEYGQYLAGRDVVVRFTLSHTVDHRLQVDRFVTNIVSREPMPGLPQDYMKEFAGLWTPKGYLAHYGFRRSDVARLLEE